MQVEMSLAELLLNAIGNGRVPGMQFKRGWTDDRATFAGLNAVIADRLDGARRVAIESALRRAHDEHPVFRLLAENRRFRGALDKIATLGRVCPDFEICTHPPCQDSCGAVLIALEALGANPTEAASTTGELLTFVKWIAEHPDVGDTLSAPWREIEFRDEARRVLSKVSQQC